MHQMETYFDGLSWHEISADTSGVISDMMEILRKNQARPPMWAMSSSADRLQGAEVVDDFLHHCCVAPPQQCKH